MVAAARFMILVSAVVFSDMPAIVVWPKNTSSIIKVLLNIYLCCQPDFSSRATNPSGVGTLYLYGFKHMF